MKCIAVTMLCLTLASCAGTPNTVADPIDVLVERLRANNGIWLNGGSPTIDLHQDADPKEVIAEAVRKQPFDQGMIQSYEIQNMRQIELSNLVGKNVKYTAAWIKTDWGSKVIVFNFETFGHWWARFYSVEQESRTKPSTATE